MWLELILFFFGFFVFLPGTVWIIWWLNKGRGLQAVTPDAPLIDCTVARESTNGYCLGRVKNQEPRPNGTIYFEMYPYDGEEGEDRPIPEVQRFVAAKEMIIRLPKGSASARREKIHILSRNPTDLPEALRDTTNGKGLTAAGQLAHLIKTFGTAIPNGDAALASALLDYARGAEKVSAHTWSQVKGSLDMARNLMENEDNDKKK